jgi:hypothetical protein
MDSLYRRLNGSPLKQNPALSIVPIVVSLFTGVQVLAETLWQFRHFFCQLRMRAGRRWLKYENVIIA